MTGLGAGSRRGRAASTGTESETIETIDTTIKSFDGTELALTLYEPSGTGRHPALIWLQGGVSTRDTAEFFARFWAKEGYLVLTYDPRGVGDSEGLVRSAGPRDLKDISALVDFLADHTKVVNDSPSDPRVGMEGSSAGGWRSFRAASRDDRIDAISGLITPYDGANTVAQNTVLKWPWAYFVYVSVRSPQANVPEKVLDWAREAIETKEPPQEYLDYLSERSPKNGVRDIEAPALIDNAWTDRLFPAEESFELYRGLSASAERRLVLQDYYAHNFADPPGTPAQVRFVRKLRKQWFAKHLQDETPSEDSPLQDPPIHLYRAQTDTFEAYESLPDGGASFDLGEVRPGGATTLKTTTDGTTHRARFDFPVNTQLDLAGVSRLSLDVAPTGGEPKLFAALKDVPPGSSADPVHLKTQITAVEVPEPDNLELEMNGVERTVESGHTLRLELTLNDDALADVENIPSPELADGLYVDSEKPAGLTVHHSRGRTSTLEVTTIDS